MPTTATQAPTLAATIIEVQGIFEDDQTLQDAISRLTLAGFDRADLSLPIASPAPGEATPELGAATPTTDIDRQQMRTLGASAAAATGAIAAAGITIATGGLAAAAAAAAVVTGAAAGGLTAAATHVGDRLRTDERNEAGAAGELVLSARATDATRQGAAEAAMRAAGARRVEVVRRANGGLDR
jgi:hypothetical protein